MRPLGDELISNGAIKECGSGDAGHGPDNNAAYYAAYYNLRTSKDAAISLINRVARDNGYKLTHASPRVC
ncbi:MAG TPA: hypothetical protein VFV38_11905 [Ktedonobacteraceae bacterium]|nr:hypothetical protein [Ktedonobacteraceae bacterium]